MRDSTSIHAEKPDGRLLIGVRKLEASQKLSRFGLLATSPLSNRQLKPIQGKLCGLILYVSGLVEGWSWSIRKTSPPLIVEPNPPIWGGK